MAQEFDRSMFMDLQNQQIEELAKQQPGFDRWQPPAGDFTCELAEVRYPSSRKEEGKADMVLVFRIAEGEFTDKKFDDYNGVSRQSSWPIAASKIKALFMGMEGAPTDLLSGVERAKECVGEFYQVKAAAAENPSYMNYYINARLQPAKA